MRKLVVWSCVFLIISGLDLHYKVLLEELAELSGFSVISALHIWTGIFFTVIFPMYAWDHIQKHREHLQRLSWISISGAIQLLSGIGIIGSGLVLLLYGSNKLMFSTELHFILTFVLAGSLVAHFFTKK